MDWRIAPTLGVGTAEIEVRRLSHLSVRHQLKLYLAVRTLAASIAGRSLSLSAVLSQ